MPIYATTAYFWKNQKSLKKQAFFQKIARLGIDIFAAMSYTILNLKCAITLVILNLHHFKRDSYIV